MSQSKMDEIKRRVTGGPKSDVHAQLLGTREEKTNTNDSLTISSDTTHSDNTNANTGAEVSVGTSPIVAANANVNTSVDVNIASIPIAQPKKGIRETHTTKAFYIRNDLAALVNEDIRNGRRGAMTEIVNALFEQYYRSLGRIK